MKRGFGERLGKAIVNKGFNNNSLSKLVKIHPTTISNWRSEKTEPDNLKLDIVAKALDVSKDWLTDEVGEMIVVYLNDETGESLLKQGIGVIDKSKPVDTVTPVPTDNYMWVEYADLSAAAGELGGNNIDTLPETKKRLVPREYENGEYLVIRVDGSSMDDGSKYSIPDGTEILIKKYYLNPGEKLPIRNNLFVVNAREGKALKQIVEHNIEEEYICCHSYNPDFKDYKIHLEDILEIFIYRKVVSSRPPIPDIN